MADLAAMTERIDRAIGERVRGARKARGVTQSALGEALGITFQQVQKYERGTNRISSSALMIIADALEVSPLELMGRTDAKTSEIDWDLFAAEGSRELLNHFRGITSAKLRRAVVDLARTLSRAESD